MINNNHLQPSTARATTWIALVLTACLLILPPVAEQIYRHQLVVPTSERELLRRFDELLAEYPERTRRLKAALFTSPKMSDDCSDCFSPTVLERIGKVYISTLHGGQRAFYEIERMCSSNDAGCIDNGLVRTPVTQSEIEAYLASVGGVDECDDAPILLSQVRFCKSTLTYLGEIHGVTVDVRIQPARLNPIAWFLRTVDPKGWVHIDHETGACTYSNLPSISDQLRKLRCVDGKL